MCSCLCSLICPHQGLGSCSGIVYKYSIDSKERGRPSSVNRTFCILIGLLAFYLYRYLLYHHPVPLIPLPQALKMLIKYIASLVPFVVQLPFGVHAAQAAAAPFPVKSMLPSLDAPSKYGVYLNTNVFGDGMQIWPDLTCFDVAPALLCANLTTEPPVFNRWVYTPLTPGSCLAAYYWPANSVIQKPTAADCESKVFRPMKKVLLGHRYTTTASSNILGNESIGTAFPNSGTDGKSVDGRWPSFILGNDFT